VATLKKLGCTEFTENPIELWKVPGKNKKSEPSPPQFKRMLA